MAVWDWKVIEKQANAALGKKPDDVNASRRQAHAIGMQGNTAQAVDMLQKHLYHNPKDAKAMDLLAAFLVIAGKPQDAIGWSDKALQADPKFVAARYNRAVACVKAGKTEEGIRDLGMAIEANGEYREIAAEDADFAGITGNARFKAVLLPPKKE